MLDEDEDIEFDPFYNAEFSSEASGLSESQQLMLVDSEECTEEEIDLYQQLAEKDHYLILAAEAGKVLLEQNKELNNHYQDLQSEYLQKIEQLEQERHHLRRELCDRENLYESRMQDLQHELTSLSGQLQVVQKSSKSYELSNKSTYNDLTYQNNSLLKELDEVKTYNHDLAQQVQTLSKRIEGRLLQQHPKLYKKSQSQTGNTDDGSNGEEKEISVKEIKILKEQVQKLSEYKQLLENSVNELAHEKAAITCDQQKTIGKVSTLEDELLSLKQQISMCQEDLDKTKRRNTQLKDQLEEYLMIQQSSQNGSQGANNSLFNELEMSLSEADRNLHHHHEFASTPFKTTSNDEEEDDDDKVLTPILTVNDQRNPEFEQLKGELAAIYHKVRKLHLLLSDKTDIKSDEQINLQSINAVMVTKMVDQVIVIIKERVLSLGVIDAQAHSPTQIDLESCDSVSQVGSHASDSDYELLEQQVHDLNQRLNIATTALENAKRDVTKAQALASEHEEKSLTLTVQVNSQEREIEALRKERQIMMADTTMEEKLKKALEERDAALKRENEISCKYETAQNDMQKLNNQLIAAVQQKLELSEQLEQWQFDMASLIDQQLATKIKKEQQHSRKRTSSSHTSANPARMFAAKFFAGRNNSREGSRTSTPTMKSPVPSIKT